MSLYTIAIVFHVIGAVLGVGAATIHDLQFFRAIGDKDLGVAFQKSGKFYGKIIQTGLGLLILSAAYFLYSKPALWHSEKIMTKLGLVIVLVLNGFVINFILHPKFAKLTAEDWAQKSSKLKETADKRSVFDVISIASWYSILFLGAVGRQPWKVGQMVIGYLLVIVFVYIIMRIATKKSFA